MSLTSFTNIVDLPGSLKRISPTARLHTSSSVELSHQGRPSLDNQFSYSTFSTADNTFSGWRWRISCMSDWCATFALRFIFVRLSLKSDEFVSKVITFHVGAEVEPGSAIYGLWLLHRITESNGAHAMTATLNKVWLEHSKTNRSLDYISWRCWTLYSLAMCIARKFVQDGTIRGWPAWIELDNTLIRQLEIYILWHFPLWVPRAVEGGQGRIRDPDCWQSELAKIHSKAQLLEAYVTPDGHSIALSAFEDAFGCVGSECLVDDLDADRLEIPHPWYPPLSSPLSQQSQSPLSSISPLAEDSDTELPTCHVGSFKTNFPSLPSSGTVHIPYGNIAFGSPGSDDGYWRLSDGGYSPAHPRSPQSTLGLWRVPGSRSPTITIHLTESGWSREGPILMSDSPAQWGPPSVIFGSPPPHTLTSWSSYITSTDPGVGIRQRVHSRARELYLKWRDYAHEQPVPQPRYVATIDRGI